MKAAVIYESGGPEVLRYEDVPDPECPDGCVLIDVEAISVEGGDTLNRAGGEMTGRPHIVGYQCAGTIRAVGEGVTDRQVGQKVVATMMSGSHAAMVVVPSIITWPIPDGADVIACACVPVAFGTAHDCLFEFGRLQAGESVLVQAGAGGSGWPRSSWPSGPGRRSWRRRRATSDCRGSRRSASTTASTTATTGGSMQSAARRAAPA